MSETQENYELNKLYLIDVNDLSPDPDQPRKAVNKEADIQLAKSIKDNGLIEPIIFRIDENNNKFIVAGARRWQATKDIGAETIKAIFTDSEDYFLMAYTENANRDNLHPIDDAEALKKIKEEMNLTHKELGAMFGKKYNTISDRIRLADMPDAVKDRARTICDISRQKLLAVRKAPTTDKQLAMLEDIEREMERAINRTGNNTENNDAAGDNLDNNQTGNSGPPIPKRIIWAKKAIDKTTDRIDKILSWGNDTERGQIRENMLQLREKIDQYLDDQAI